MKNKQIFKRPQYFSLTHMNDIKISNKQILNITQIIKVQIERCIFANNDVRRNVFDALI